MIEWDGYRSCLTMLLYLNGKEEGVQGGNTRLSRPDRTPTDVEPKKGLHYSSGMVTVPDR